jgi:hypothetical protein
VAHQQSQAADSHINPETSREKRTDDFYSICSEPTTNRSTTNYSTTDLATTKRFNQSICRQSDINDSEFLHNLK